MKKIGRKPPTRKKPFLLVELLVALALLFATFFPLLKVQYNVKKAQWEALEKLELERVAELAFLELKKQLYENKGYSFAQVEGEDIRDTLDLNEIYGSEKPKNYRVEFHLHKIKVSPKVTGKKRYLLAQADIHFFSKTKEKKRGSFTHTLVLEEL